MKLIQDRWDLDEELIADWDRLQEWVERNMTIRLAKKIYDKGLIEFFQQENNQGKTYVARFYVISKKEAEEINMLKDKTMKEIINHILNKENGSTND